MLLGILDAEAEGFSMSVFRGRRYYTSLRKLLFLVYTEKMFYSLN
jgi:hypothetical protein